MKKRFNAFLFCLFLLTLSITLNAQRQKYDLNDPISKDSNVVTGKLPNGITYYLRKNDTPKNRLELKLAVNAGSICEDSNQQGLAHFCEHMCFNGTEHFKKMGIVNFLESIGMKFGADLNAYTSFDETVYRMTIPTNPKEDIDTGFMILADWAHNVSFEDVEIDKERGVVHEEWRLGQGANDRMRRQWWPVLFHNSLYANRMPIGKMEIVDKCPYADLKSFYKDWYRPDLMAVVVVGDMDIKVMEENVKKYFSPIPKVENPRPRKLAEVPDHTDPLVAITKDKEARYVVFQSFWLHNTKHEKIVDDYRNNIIKGLYNTMLNERLGELLQDENPPFLYANSGYNDLVRTKDVYTSIAVAPNNELERSLHAILLENERVKKFGFLQSELTRAKTDLLRNMEEMYNERYKEKSENYASEYVRNFLSEESYPGIAIEYEFYKRLLPNISLNDVNQLAQQWITDNNQVVIITGPDKPEISYPSEDKILKIVKSVKTEDIKPWVDKASDKVLLSDIPKPGKIDKTTKNDEFGTTIWKLKNGVQVVLKQTDFKADEILMTAYAPGGTSVYPNKDDVSASLADDVIDNSGLGEFDLITLQKMLTGKIANVSPRISELTQELHGNSSPKDLESFMQLIYMYFTQPRKDPKAYNSFLKKENSMLENKSTDPETAFRDTISTTMSCNNPRRRPMTKEILQEADFNRIHYIYKDRYADASQFTFFFVGNIDLKKMKPLVETYLGGLPTLDRKETWKDLNIHQPKGVINKTVYKGVEPKSYIYISYTGPAEYNFNNRILLGATCDILSIKLRESIREDQSGAYSIGANGTITKYPEQQYSIRISFGCAPDNVEKLSNSVFDEIQKIKTNGPTEVDLNKVKETLLKKRETDLRENSFWLNLLRQYYFNDEAYKPISDYTKQVNAITGEDIKQTINKYFNYNNYVRVVLRPETTKQ